MKIKGISVDLVVPGLFDIPLEEIGTGFLQNNLSNLNHFLRFASPVNNQLFDIDRILCRQLGFSDLDYLPYAQAFADESCDSDGSIILIKPVHLKTDINNAVMYPLLNDQTDIDDSSIIIKDLADYFKADCNIDSIDNSVSLMRLNKIQPPAQTPHYLSVLGKKAKPFIDQSKQNLDWYRLINEMQMFMFQHEINQNRFQLGLPMINSLWYWGAGRLPILANKEICWYCDDLVLQKLAIKFSCQVNSIDQFISQPPKQNALIVDFSILQSLKSPESASLADVLMAFETRILEPLVQYPAISNIQLHSAADTNLLYQKFSQYKFWRRNKTLTDFTSAEFNL